MAELFFSDILQVIALYLRLAHVVEGYYRWQRVPSDLIGHFHVSTALMLRDTWKPLERLPLRFLCIDRPFTARRDSKGRSCLVAAVTTRVVNAHLPTMPRSYAVMGTVQIRVACVWLH